MLGRQRHAEVVSAVREELPTVEGDVIDMWPVHRRERSAGVDGDS